ncbi:hypothetical protein OUZ56_023138 [Daphnia magna]|uniref:Uncharacterized protein n=1 Tax=Daphnia magna TaxID=35525 RepID=A0ABR0AYE1_9CRUS|nr:hypothetical protein OUZ56_023138 [Daphnia magna]
MGTTMLTTLPECRPNAIPSNDSTCNPSAIGRRTCLDLIRSTHGDNLHGTASRMRSHILFNELEVCMNALTLNRRVDVYGNITAKADSLRNTSSGRGS